MARRLYWIPWIILGYNGITNLNCIISRCQIAVHQECYGVRTVRDFTSWVCRACETPDIERGCCLCPVKGVISRFMEACCFQFFLFEAGCFCIFQIKVSTSYYCVRFTIQRMTWVCYYLNLYKREGEVLFLNLRTDLLASCSSETDFLSLCIS